VLWVNSKGKSTVWVTMAYLISPESPNPSFLYLAALSTKSSWLQTTIVGQNEIDDSSGM